ncbi:hypothetical protein ACYF6T_02755 [Streptomyces sp. 7R007]
MKVSPAVRGRWDRPGAVARITRRVPELGLRERRTVTGGDLR